MAEPPKTHCWECRRRCLVCDFTTPSCMRCVTNGIQCPGYYEKEKPTRLKWLPPGTVVSRKPRARQSPASRCTEGRALSSTTASLAKLNMKILLPGDMTSEVKTLHEAAEYYNMCIHPDLLRICELGPNTLVFTISHLHIQHAMTQPNHLRFGFLCIALNHRINQMRKDHDLDTLPNTYYQYRGMALRSLTKDIENEDKRETDAIMASVMTLLLTDTQAGHSYDWKYHFRALDKLIQLRGGVNQLAKSPSLESMLLSFSYIAVISNTTSPSSAIVMPDSQLEDLRILLNRYGHNVFAFQLCPPELFGSIIQINHIRMRATKQFTARNEMEELRLEAHTILAKIYEFSSSTWAGSKPASTEVWQLSGNVYKSAVLIYCILSLQGVSLLPNLPIIQESYKTSTQRLEAFLFSALQSLSLKRFMLWPLIVLGVAGANISSDIQAFVSTQLPELSRFSGLDAPIVAKQVLERFWALGDTSWDACFDRPYAFTMHAAIDVSRI